ncbi:MAG: bifunctional hydroxymethylpyrimidine kinase/phosphomethylpyrimidine kinase, partial [Verrucomicrobiales bacterium]|nr:bifunctional hydroxymethylpyrimidine kinase/phosphomethylpyrimidine kinase [Verrucomicrobiales bacterium]
LSPSTMTPPPILSIAGSDSSCGAGVQADLKAITALGGYALNALTSVVSETPGNVSLVRNLDGDIIADQIRILFAGFPIAAAKSGMLGGREQVQVVVSAWQKWAPKHTPLVVDPVMVATGGGKLLEDEAVLSLIEDWLPLATVITPNMDEAAVLWGRELSTKDDLENCAVDLAKRFGTAMLVKGGHLTDLPNAPDVLCTRDGKLSWYDAPRTPGVKTHGTGCTYSAAIATCLGQGMAVPAAVARAKTYVSKAISAHFVWETVASGTVHALNHQQNN